MLRILLLCICIFNAANLLIIVDLKKLIKYDNRPLQDIIENREIHTESSKLSRVADDISHHRFFAPTISSTAKLNGKTKKSTENLQILPRQCSLHKNILCPHNTQSKGNEENKKPVPLPKEEKKTNKMCKIYLNF